LDTLLDAYEQIGENIPPLMQYNALFVNNSNMRKVLELYYGDILEFHRRALTFFKRPGRLPTRMLSQISPDIYQPGNIFFILPGKLSEPSLGTF
jgi:hypothetical protein